MDALAQPPTRTGCWLRSIQEGPRRSDVSDNTSAPYRSPVGEFSSGLDSKSSPGLCSIPICSRDGRCLDRFPRTLGHTIGSDGAVSGAKTRGTAPSTPERVWRTGAPPSAALATTSKDSIPRASARCVLPGRDTDLRSTTKLGCVMRAMLLSETCRRLEYLSKALSLRADRP